MRLSIYKEKHSIVSESSTPQDQRQGAWLPIISLLYSAAYWGIVWYPLRLLEAEGLSGLWQTLISYTAAFAVTLPWLRNLSRIESQRVAYALLAIAAGGDVVLGGHPF